MGKIKSDGIWKMWKWVNHKIFLSYCWTKQKMGRKLKGAISVQHWEKITNINKKAQRKTVIGAQGYRKRLERWERESAEHIEC